MPETKSRRKRVGKQSGSDRCDDSPCSTPPEVRGARWVVRTGHSQPGPYRGPPATLPTSGCVDANARGLGVVRSSPGAVFTAEPSGQSARSSLRPKSAVGRAHDGASSSLPAFPGGPVEAHGGDGLSKMLVSSMSEIPMHLVSFPNKQGWSDVAAGQQPWEDAGPSTSDDSGGTLVESPSVQWAAMPQTPDALLALHMGNEDLDDGLLEAWLDTERMHPIGGMPTWNQARRLELEHTFIQGQENHFCGLLEDLRRLWAGGAADGLPRSSLRLFEKAKDLNRVRYQHGDDYDRLTQSIQAVQISSVTDVRNPAWNPGDMTSSPLAALAAANWCRMQVVGAPPKLIQLPTIGRRVDVGKLLDVCAQYRGPPCTITSSDVRPPGCEMLSDLFATLNECRANLVHQMAQVSDFDPRLADLEARFASLRNEYGMLYCLVCCANARLIGPWRQDWEPPYELKHQMLQIVESLGVTEDQRWQLKQMRERSREIILTAKAAQTVNMDIADDVARANHLVSSSQTIDFLDIIEAAEEAKFMVPAVDCMVAQAALSNILSPLQSARMVIYGVMLYMGRLNPLAGERYEAADFWRFMAACFLDPQLGSWLDDAQPPGVAI